MVQAGTYRGKPVRAALGLASTGTEQIAVQFEFVDPPGERLTWFGFFTEKATERTIESLRHCGWKGDDLSVFAEGQPPPEGFDQEVELVVTTETYQGKTQTRIAFINGGGGLAMKNALTHDQADAFAKRMKSKIGAFDRAAGRSTAPAQARPQGRPPARAAAAAGPGEVPHELLEQQAGQQGDDPF